MAKRERDTRVIHRGVTITQEAPQKELTKGERKPSIVSKTFLPGQEDQLEKLLTPVQIARLKARGAIDGNWEAGRKKAPVVEPAPDPGKGGQGKKNP